MDRMKKKGIYLFLLFFTIPFFINSLEAQVVSEKRIFYVAQQSFCDGFYDVAIEKLKAFIDTFPESKNINSAYLLLGRSYYEKGAFHLALGEFEKIISSSDLSEKDEAYYWIGKVYLEGLDLAVARSLFKKIIDDFPKSDFLDYAHYYLAVIANMSGNYNLAEEECVFIIKHFPQSELLGATYVEMAKSLYRLAKIDESNNILTECLKKFSQSPSIDRIYFQLGENSFLSSDFRHAIDFYKKTLEVNPQGDKKEEALKKIGIAYFELKEYRNAITVFDELIETNPGSPFLEKVTFLKGKSLRMLGQDEVAILIFEKLAESEKDKPDYGLADDSYFLIADTYYKKGKYEKAIFFYDIFKQKFPKSPLKEEVFYNLGWTYLRLKRYEEAIAELQKLTQEKISKDEMLKIIALCRLGDTYLDKGEHKQAMGSYNKVLEDYPNSFYSDYAQYQLALVLERIARFNEAIISLDTLICNFPDSKLIDQAHYMLALLYLKKGEYKKSLECYRNITLNFPDSQYRELSMLGEGYCYYNLGEFNRALDTFRKFKKDFGDSEYKERVKFEIAQTLFACGREKEASEEFTRLAQGSQDVGIKDEAGLWLAQYDLRCDNYQAAERQFNSLKQESSNNYFKSLAYYWLGKIAYLKGGKEESLRFFELASNLSTTDSIKLKIDFEKADVFLELSELKKALSIYDRIIAVYPESNFALFSCKKKADIQLSQGKFALARQNYKHALTEVKSDFNAQIQFQIAKTYLDEDKLLEALSEFFSVVYLYPDSTFWKERAQLEAADIYQRQGKLEEARKIYFQLSQVNTEVSELAKSKLKKLSETNDIHLRTGLKTKN